MATKNDKIEENGSIQKSKYEKDLDVLIELGLNLQDWYKSSYKNQDCPNPDIEHWSKFFQKYQTWYSESMVLIKICLPDRLNDFKKLYEKQAKRIGIDYENYVIEDALAGLTTTYFTTKLSPKDALLKFQMQLSILISARQTFKSSLFSLKSMLQADLFDSDIVAAKNLNKNGFVRAAGAMCGVVIEKHLSVISDIHELKVNKINPTINVFNDLLKTNNIYQISYRLQTHRLKLIPLDPIALLPKSKKCISQF